MMIDYGKPNRAPMLFDNVFGQPAWSGLYEHMLTESMIQDMLNYVGFRANRFGFNDACYGRIGGRINIFSPELLGGEPYLLWEKSYKEGVKQFCSEEALASLTPKSDRDIEARNNLRLPTKKIV